MEKRKRKRLSHWQMIAAFLMCFDAVAFAFSYFLGLWMRFDFRFSEIPSAYLDAYVRFIPIYIIGAICIFWLLRLYRGMWRFAGFRELTRYSAASLITSAFHIIGITLLFCRMPMAYYITGMFVQLILVVSVRFSYRFYLEILKRKNMNETEIPHERVMIIGAGSAGQMIIRELQISHNINCTPCCVIDDNSNKWGRFIQNVPIVGGRDDITSAAKKYGISQIYFCIPTATGQQRKEILEICKETQCKLLTLPGIYQLASEEVLVSRLKPVSVEDLLGRDPVKVDMEEIFDQLEGKTILVTGGGGSIGSELCRQIAEHDPKELIIFDIYENTTYQTELELREKHPDLKLTVLIGSVQDGRRVDEIFDEFRPDIVYHAAAHKHVPLMEFSPNEAIKNNVMGTYITARAALKYGTSRFVLISTDKAVNPTNIMGASKRLCEMVIQSMDEIAKSGRTDILPKIGGDIAETSVADNGGAGSGRGTTGTGNAGDCGPGQRAVTQFVAVRFGNVLGSNGSVLPRFQKQIEDGGPVTVTHPDIVRYFMTIPEAVSLVLQAGCYAKGGEIFVLDMDDPVKIDTLARNLIRLSGYQPDVDIQVVYTGLRPGEKLFEEKLMAEEGIRKTANDLIYIGQPVPFDTEEFMRDLDDLADAAYDNSPDIVQMVEDMVPTFHPVGDNRGGQSRQRQKSRNRSRMGTV